MNLNEVQVNALCHRDKNHESFFMITDEGPYYRLACVFGSEMNTSMLDILACPIDKHYPLELFQIVSEGQIVKEGILFCTKCSRYYPIIDEIPVMLPDELRERQKAQDIEFLRKWQNKIPDKVIRQGNPWHL